MTKLGKIKEGFWTYWLVEDASGYYTAYDAFEEKGKAHQGHIMVWGYTREDRDKRAEKLLNLLNAGKNPVEGLL